jgi:hypothetical protein
MFFCGPDLLEDEAEFLKQCDLLRRSMLHALEKHGPINLWRAGQVTTMQDPVSGEFVVRLRQRAASTPSPDWTLPHDCTLEITEGGAYHVVPRRCRR